MSNKNKKTPTIHTCSITGCEKTWLRGGRVGRDGEPELCPMHYHRERRGSPNAGVADELRTGARLRTHFSLPAEVSQRLATFAIEVGRSQSEIVAEAVDRLIASRECARSR